MKRKTTNDLRETAAHPATTNDLRAAAADPATTNDLRETAAHPAGFYTENFLKNQIESAREMYQDIYNVSVDKVSQRRFNHVLKYIYDNAIYPLNIDYRNIVLLNNLCNIYLNYICPVSNKSSSVYGFCIFIGIPYTSLINNKYSTNKQLKDLYIDISNNKVLDEIEIDIYKQLHKESVIVKSSKDIYTDIIKKIESDREHALTDQAENGSVMSLALGKIQYGWIESAKEKIQVEMLENYRLPGDLLSKYSDN